MVMTVARIQYVPTLDSLVVVVRSTSLSFTLLRSVSLVYDVAILVRLCITVRMDATNDKHRPTTTPAGAESSIVKDDKDDEERKMSSVASTSTSTSGGSTNDYSNPTGASVQRFLTRFTTNRPRGRRRPPPQARPTAPPSVQRFLARLQPRPVVTTTKES